MRILAIRGKNLASLANEFEVLLEEGVLQQAGLFAITGRTGSGKSTILDALCLALYDQMPRLPEGYGVGIGHKDEDESTRVKSNDVSSILRRGTASAYAEVDFIGKDKHSYQARWEISRARGKIEGKLQPQKISLININTQEKIGEGKRDTLLKIVDKIGLNFAQFRRSVLLAQGDFAAFLKAKKDDRSSLLEKITGTDIYSELSIAAFERAKLEKQGLDKIEAQLADKVPLEKEARAKLEVEKQAILNQLIGVEQALKQQQLLLDWFSTVEQLTQIQAQAEQQSQQAQQQWERNSEDRELLDQVEQVQVLRPLLTQVQSLTNEVQDAEQKLTQNKQVLQQVEKSVFSLQQQLSEDEQQFKLAVQQSNTAEPLLIAARQLDTQIISSDKRLNQIKQQCATQEESIQKLLVKLTQLKTQKQQQEQDLQQLVIWQEQHSAIQALANEWGRWHAGLNELLTLQQTLQLQTEENTEQQKLKQKKQLALKELQLNNASTLKEKNKLNQQLSQLEAKAEQHALAELHQQKAQLEKEQQAITEAVQLVETSVAVAASLQQDSATSATIETQKILLKSQSAELKQQQLQLSIQLDEAEKALAVMQAASQKTAESLRSILIEEIPCPVCGATEHPWQEAVHAVNQPVSEQQARVKSLVQEKEKRLVELSEQASAAKQLAKEKHLIEERIQKNTCDQALLIEQWQQNELLDALDWAQIQEADLFALHAKGELIKSAYQLAKQQEEQALALQQQIAQVRTQAETVNQTYTQKTGVLAELEKSLAELSSRLTVKQELQSSLMRDKQNLIKTLSIPMQKVEGWQDELMQTGERFVQKIADLVSQWHKKSEEERAGETCLQEIEKEYLLLAADQAQQNNLYTQYQQAQTEEKEQQRQLIEQRQTYFEGIAANDYAQQITQQLHQATEKKQNSAEQLNHAKTEIKTLHSTMTHWLDEQQRRLKNKAIVEKTLNTELSERHISKKLLQALLTKDDKWVVAQKLLQQALLKAVQETQADVKIKAEALQAHTKQAPKQDKEQVTTQIQTLLTEQATLQQEKDNRLYLLRADDEKIRLGKALQTSLMAQREQWEQWESLNELIGSQKGHKFRIFAQGLTLETLLSYTNSHLQEFAQRYHLQRVPGSDLELQVIDRDMADEVRSVHSLSGGESFLVSLALALGLASLSSNRIQVESLFIDEGFGSLDAETLDIAIASLDTLQSLGRKVGIISHVPVLVERIGAQVVVEKVGGGKSIVSVQGYV